MAKQKRVKMKKSCPNKELLIEWLRTALDYHLYPGLLEWSDKEQEIFYVKWVHKSSEQWSDEDLEPFRAWAGHKGKLIGKNPKQLKATFRCALNSKKELEEHHRGRERRYWKFVDPNTAEKDKTPKKRRRNNKVAKSRVDDTVSVSCNHDIKSSNDSGFYSPRTSPGNEDKMSRSIKLPSYDSFSNFEPLTPPDQSNENSYTCPDFKFSKEQLDKLEKCGANYRPLTHVPLTISSISADNSLLDNMDEVNRTNYTPPPDQSRLSPPQKTHHIPRNHSNTDVWQPNCWPLPHADKEPKGLSDFFSSDFIGIYKTSCQEPENNASMDFLDMDQYVPVMNTSNNVQIHNRHVLTTLVNRTPSSNPIQTDHLLEDFFLGDDIDQEACRRLMQEIERTSSIPHYRLHP